MGRVIAILHKIRDMSDEDLLNRFEHILIAKGIRDYLAEKEDKDLSLEVRLAKEEILKRMFTVDKQPK